MQRPDRRHPSNRATTAIIDAAIAMRRHRGSELAIEFLLKHGVQAPTVTRVLGGVARGQHLDLIHGQQMTS